MTTGRGPQRHQCSLGLPPEPVLSFPESHSLQPALSSILPTDWSFLKPEDWKCCSRHKAAVFEPLVPGAFSRGFWDCVTSPVRSELRCHTEFLPLPARSRAGCGQAITRRVQWDCPSSVVLSSGAGFPLHTHASPVVGRKGRLFLPAINRKGWKCNQK